MVNEKRNAGYHQVDWDASVFASGIYYYRIEAGKFQDVNMMILLCRCQIWDVGCEI